VLDLVQPGGGAVTAPVSVVISSYQEGGALARTVAAVSDARPRPAQIVIADDGSSDGSTDHPWPAHVTVLRRPHTGIAAARNAGARAATQPALVFLDAHCTVDDGWLDPLLRTLDTHPSAVLGPAVRDADYPSYAGCGAQIVDPVFTYKWMRATGTEPLEVGLIPGGCLAVSRAEFLRHGGFADRFTGFGLEDVELSLRWWRAGRPVLGVPASLVTHEFRTHPPYPPARLDWLQNVLRTGLRHLTGEPLRACVLACARFADFVPAISTVLAEGRHDGGSTSHGRPLELYLDRWAPNAFTR
jgi:glycosyltransferase involved in cell wall biosynthesis